MKGIITTPLILWIILIIFSFLINTAIFNLAARLMEFKNKKWKTSMFLSFCVVVFTAIYSGVITFLKVFTFLTQALGIILFVILVYYLTQRIYAEEEKKQRAGFCFFATLFALLLNAVLLVIVTLLNNVFAIV